MSTNAIQLPAPDTLNGQVLRNVRKLRGLYDINQTRLADVLGVSQTQISRRLRGSTAFTLTDIERLADFFRVTPAALLGHEKMPPDPLGVEGEKLPRLDSNQQPFDDLAPVITFPTRTVKSQPALEPVGA